MLLVQSLTPVETFSNVAANLTIRLNSLQVQSTLVRLQYTLILRLMTRQYQFQIPLQPYSTHVELQSSRSEIKYDERLSTGLLLRVLDPNHGLVPVPIEHGKLAIGEQVGVLLANGDELFVEREYAFGIAKLSLDVDGRETRIHFLPWRSVLPGKPCIRTPRPLHRHPSVISCRQLQPLSSSFYSRRIVLVRLVDPGPPIDALRVHIVFDRIRQRRVDDSQFFSLIDERRTRLSQEIESEEFSRCNPMFWSVRGIPSDTSSAIVLQDARQRFESVVQPNQQTTRPSTPTFSR